MHTQVRKIHRVGTISALELIREDGKNPKPQTPNPNPYPLNPKP
jgi:hypothetical protein